MKEEYFSKFEDLEHGWPVRIFQVENMQVIALTSRKVT